MESRRFALVGPFYPYRGGIAHFSESLCSRLRRRGHQVLPVTFKRQYPGWLFPGQSQLEPAPVLESGNALRLLDTLNPVTWDRVARRIAGCDGVVFQHWLPLMAPPLAYVARRSACRTVVVAHNVFGHERRPGDRLLVRMLLGAADGLLAMSESVKSEIAALGVQAPVEVAPHPVYESFGSAPTRSEARRALALDDDRPVLLFFGFVRKYKGLGTLLRSLPAAVAAVPGLRLLVAGEFYDDEAPYYALMDSLGVRNCVDVDARYIPSELVGTYFRAADVVVQPYQSATQSGVAQIAYHFGTPIITTDVGGLAETVPDGKAGLVVPPENPDALAAAIVRYFVEDLGPVLAEGARNERHRNSWDYLCEVLEALA